MNQPLINYIFNHWIARLQICPLYIFRKQIRQQMVAIKIHFFGNSRVCPLRLPVDESRRRPRWTTMKSDRWTWNLAEAWLMMGSRHPRWRPNFRILGIKKVSCSFVEGDRHFQKNACWTWSNEEHMILQQVFLGCFGGTWINFWDIHNIEFHRHFHISESSLRRKNKKQATKAGWQSMPWGDTKRP